MTDSLFRFFGEHPFWAVFIAVFMILPMIGAVLHIVLKALGRKGIDNSPPGGNLADLTSVSDSGGRPDSPGPLEKGEDSRDQGHSGSDSRD
jgi:hypothetical protein